MAVDLGQVVADSVDDVLVEALELGGRVERADVKGQLLRAVEEELDAAQARFVGLELETPFRCGLAVGVVVGVGVGDFRGDFVGGDAIATGPGFYDFNVVGCGCVDGCDAL